MLLAKLDVFDAELKRRDAIATAYDAGMPAGIVPPVRVSDSESAWAIYTILLPDSEKRDSLQTFLKDAGVPTAVYYPKPLHHQPAYAPHHDGVCLPVAEGLGARVLALPIHPELTDEDVHYIITALNRWAGEQA